MNLKFLFCCFLSLASMTSSAQFFNRFQIREDSGVYSFPRPGGRSKPAPVRPSSKKTVPIVMYVITDNAGRGNDKWLMKEYTDKVIAEVNNYFSSDVVRFKITRKIQVKDTERYHWNQKKLLDKYDSKDQRGLLTVVISSETYDGRSSGITHGRLDSEPFFVMRSRYNSLDRTADDYFDSPIAHRKTARLFIHELGHEMGLDHRDQIRKDKGEVIHTENFVEPGKDGNVNGKGRRFYENYFRNCLLPKSRSCRRGSVK